MKDFLTELQNKPYETRVKILWSSVLVIGIVILAIWILSLKTTLTHTEGRSLISQETSKVNPEASEKFAEVERVEKTDRSLKIYFNLNNSTDDILNVPKLNDINLTVDDNNLHPRQISDRQGQTFVQKILSHTQAFGILTFDPASAQTGKLTFDQMFFEKTPETVFKQTLDLDFAKLNQTSKLRN